MSLPNPSQQACWEKLEMFGLHSKSQKLGFNAYASRTKRARGVSIETRERAPRALVRAPRRGRDASGRLLPGWVLLSCGIATYAA
jgi:hypothetical protein